MHTEKLRVLLTNDDGPPGPDSPYIYGFARHLSKNLGWDVKVVVPSSQKSWIGKAFHIKEIVKGRYYYPREPDGLGETSSVSRPLQSDKAEFSEWILLDGTPATCANVALHNLFPDKIDLVISGPNLGRNSSAAFALSSGTIGAALSSSLSHVRAIALSYGTVGRPVPDQFYEPAHELSGQIIQKLWNAWGKDDSGLRNGEVDLYNVNIPMVDALVSEAGMRVVWTNMWRNAYGRLFTPHKLVDSKDPNPEMDPGGPDAPLSPGPENGDRSPETSGRVLSTVVTPQHARELTFKFAPEMRHIVNPDLSTLPKGCDAWAIAQGWASVTPLRASFAEPSGPDPESVGTVDDTVGSDSSSAGRDNGVKLFKL